ncbi:MAG: chorismate mutase [Clostridia bacterium]|nr:chorismate mutase [Clostridia bacterium]
MNPHDELDALRRRIDGIDAQLIALFCERLRTIDEVAACKRGGGLPLYCPQRETALTEARTGSLDPDMRRHCEALLNCAFRQSRLRQAAQLNLYVDCSQGGSLALVPVLSRKLGMCAFEGICDARQLVTIAKRGRTVAGIDFVALKDDRESAAIIANSGVLALPGSRGQLASELDGLREALVILFDETSHDAAAAIAAAYLSAGLQTV